MNKNELFELRDNFFNDILSQLENPASDMDLILNQSKYYVRPNMDKVVKNVSTGDLAIPINGSFFDKKFRLYYTLWQTGTRLKIGVAIYDDEMQDIFERDTHKEIDSIWPDCIPLVDVAHGCVFYDWTFDAKNLYESYQNAEKYILGMRHMHFRIMRIVHDNCELFHLEKQKDLLRENLDLRESGFSDDGEWKAET